MAKTNYEELMKRYVTNEVTEEERLRIEAWLDMLVDKNTTDLHLTLEEQEALYQKIINKEENIEAIRAFRPATMIRKIQTTWTLRIAAGIMLFLSIGYVLYRVQNAPNTGIEKIVLNDGTLVWLHGKSKLSYYERNGERYAELDGEGLFEVAKDASHPFVLHYKDVNMRVVGTSFNVKTGDRVELKVLTGKVTVTTSQDTLGVVVERNEQLTYNIGNGLQKTELKVEETSQLIAHTE
jgi:transmembrane sensor